MHISRVSIVTVAMWLASSNPVFAGESDAEAFGARRWPNAPTLEINDEPRLCAGLLAAATEAFLSNDSDLDIAAAIKRRFESVPMNPLIAADRSSSSSLYRADLDLDGDGHLQTVIYRDNEFNWSGDWHYSYVFPSPKAFESATAAVLAAWQKSPPDNQYPPPGKLELGAQQYFPSAISSEGKTIQTGDAWAPHSLFEYEGRYYFPFGLSDSDRLQPNAVTIYRLRASGKVEPRCRISPVGSAENQKSFPALPAVASYLTVIRRIGNPGPDQGTMHSAIRHDAQAEAAVTRAAFRPWTLSAIAQGDMEREEYFVFGPRMSLFLEKWSLLGLWNRREYQTLLALMTPAAESYAAFLRAEFGMSETAAKRGAKQVVERLLARRILIPSGFEEGSYGFDYFPTSPLHHAVMVRDREEFDATVDLTETTAAANKLDPGAEHAEYSRVLLESVEWSYAIDRLLELGANPNHVNDFGKSALMTAAHLDRVDAVRKLLRAGAKVNLQTTQGRRLGNLLTRTRRTALMYAAENASPAVIKALLDAGADASAKDSQGNDVSFYLANNPRFTEEERRRGIAAIAAGADRFSRPSFDCAHARTDSELTICTSAALRAFDTQIADAFARLRQKTGSAAVLDQRTWLKSRDSACGSNQDADCLAEVMRTRLRYLHLRLVE